MKCTNDEIMVHHPKHDGGAISHVNVNKYIAP